MLYARPKINLTINAYIYWGNFVNSRTLIQWKCKRWSELTDPIYQWGNSWKYQSWSITHLLEATWYTERQQAFGGYLAYREAAGIWWRLGIQRGSRHLVATWHTERQQAFGGYLTYREAAGIWWRLDIQRGSRHFGRYKILTNRPLWNENIYRNILWSLTNMGGL